MASEIRVNTINNRSGLGTISITNSGAVFSGVTTFAQIQTTSGEITVGTGASVFSPATNVLALGTDNAERVRITSTGRVGIGTDNPQRQFHIFGNSGAIIHRTGGDPQLVLRSDYYDVDGTEWRFRVVSGDGRFVLRRTNQSTSLETLTINNSDGKIGVNQETPQRQLHVKSGANNNDGAFRIESSTNNIMDMGTDGTGHFLNCVNTDPFRIKFAGSEKVRITSSGDVGIGTDNPTKILHLSQNSDVAIRMHAGNANANARSWEIIVGGNASNNAEMVFRTRQDDGTGGSECARIKRNGTIALPSGGGIDFSATSDASGSTSELLDDYEEGTWTPTYESSGASFTYAVSTSGTYVKIGRMVFCRGTLRTHSVSGGSASNSVSIGGLPFTVNNSSYNIESGWGGVHVFIGASGTFNGEFPTSGQTTPNTTTAPLYYRSTSDGNTNPLLYSDLKTGTNQNFIKFDLRYEV